MREGGKEWGKEGWRQGSSEWVYHCATGFNCPESRCFQSVREVMCCWAQRSPIQDLRHESPYTTTITGLLVSGETIPSVLIPDWLCWATPLSEKLLNSQQPSDGRKWSCSVFLVLVCVSCLVILARFSSKSNGKCLSLNASKLGHWAGCVTTRKV